MATRERDQREREGALVAELGMQAEEEADLLSREGTMFKTRPQIIDPTQSTALWAPMLKPCSSSLLLSSTSPILNAVDSL